MKEILNVPGLLPALISSIVAIVVVLLNHRHHKKTSNYKTVIEGQKEILKELNGKSNVDDCEAFEDKMEHESQDHYNSTRKIERALSYLVTKAGGTPADLDLG